MTAVLRLGALERIALGATAVAAPLFGFGWLQQVSGAAPQLIGLVGVLIGASGIALAVAARAPYRHWPVVLIVALETVYVLITAAAAAVTGSQWAAAPALAHSALWLVPLASILWSASRHGSAAQVHDADGAPVSELLRLTLTNEGDSLTELSREQPVLLVFLRHFGCTFCRETLADIVNRRHEIAARNTGIVLVHMAADVDAKPFLSHYGLEDLPRVSDPQKRLYRAFDLDRGSFLQLLGPRVWWRALSAGILQGHGMGKLLGDGLQMPGAFVIFHGDVIRTFRHRSLADRPDYLEVACALPSDDALAA